MEMSAQWNLLHAEDWSRYTKGKTELIRHYDEFYDIFDPPFDDDCQRKSTCSDARIRAVTRLRTMFNTGFAQQPDILWRAFQMLEKKNYHQDFCNNCKVKVDKGLRSLIERIWCDLPEMFDLDVQEEDWPMDTDWDAND